ncbi:MAG: TolC family protein [bacterium]
MRHGLHSTVLLLLIASNGNTPLCRAADTTTEPSGRISLAQALVLANERHPDLDSARLETQAAAGRVFQAGARQNPSISLEAENFGGQNEQTGFRSAEYTAQVEQIIELGGKRDKRLHIAKAEQQLTLLGLKSMRLDIRTETTRLFIALLGAQERVGLAKETVALTEDLVKAAAARVKSGKVSPMELEKAHVLLSQTTIALEQAMGDLQTARILLAAQWSSVAPAFESAAGDLTAIPEVPLLSEITSRLSGNPDLARWTTEVERAQALLSQEKATRVPDLTVAAGIRRSSETDSDTFVAGVSLPLPICDRNQGAVQSAAAMFEKAGKQRRAAEIRATADLMAAHQAFSTVAKKASALKTGVLPRVKTVLDAIRSGYTQGKFAYLEVLDAQRTLVEARTEYIEALISAHSALAELERVAGGSL